MLRELLGLNNESMDFKDKCKRRIRINVLFMLLGLVVFMISLIFSQYLADSESTGLPSFYAGLGVGAFAGGFVRLLRNRRYLTDEQLGSKRQVYEMDERIRLMGLRSWSYTGYTMFLLLYLGIVISGFYNVIVMRTLLAVTAIFVLVLFAFSRYLKKIM